MMKSYHKYFVFATGIKNFKEKSFATRLDAEIYMHKICEELDIHVECTECDKHERMYSNFKNVIFYINRV